MHLELYQLLVVPILFNNFPLLNHPFWGTTIYGNPHIYSSLAHQLVRNMVRPGSVLPSFNCWLPWCFRFGAGSGAWAASAVVSGFASAASTADAISCGGCLLWAGLDTVSAILCAACLVPAHLNCNCCRFLLWVSFGLWSMSSICCSVCCSFCCRLAVSVERLLMQFHLEVPALPILHAVSAILCAACLVPAHFKL